jgi:hypothetical protein
MLILIFTNLCMFWQQIEIKVPKSWKLFSIFQIKMNDFTLDKYLINKNPCLFFGRFRTLSSFISK